MLSYTDVFGIFTTTISHYNNFSEQRKIGLPKLFQQLTIHPPIHNIVVHGIPSSFAPLGPKNMAVIVAVIVALNPKTISDFPLF